MMCHTCAAVQEIRTELINYENDKPFLSREERIKRMENIFTITMKYPELLAKNPKFRRAFISKLEELKKDVNDSHILNKVVPRFLSNLVCRYDYVNENNSRYNLRDRTPKNYKV